MHPTQSRPAADIQARLERAKVDYSALCKAGLKIDMTRGKPSAAQLDLSNAMLTLPGNGDFYQADGGDTRNYFGSVQGLPEARALFSRMMGAPPERILIGNNSSLAIMHDCIVYALLKGVPGGTAPWSAAEPITFLCPAPGYDRHFAICEAYGIRMITVPLTGSGPDMEVVERLALDPAVRGMWCVPKYSNPTGETYSEEVVRRIAGMRTGAPISACSGTMPMASIISPTGKPARQHSRPCAAGRASGSAARVRLDLEDDLCGSRARPARGIRGEHQLVRCAQLDAIDRTGQAQSAPASAVPARSCGHRAPHGCASRLLEPKFRAVEAAFERRLQGTGFARWSRPHGGYFVSVDVRAGCAARVVALAKQAGIAMVAGGQTFPIARTPATATCGLHRLSRK